MKTKILSIICCAALCLTACGQVGSENNDTLSSEVSNNAYSSTPLIQPDDIPTDAETVYDVADLMNETKKDMLSDERILKYSECPDDEELLFRSTLLSSSDLEDDSAGSYFIIEQNGEKYLMFNYIGGGYGIKLKAVTDMKKEYSGGRLVLTPVCETEEFEQVGCEPCQKGVICIVKLDEDISEVEVEGQKYTPYKGGIVWVGDLCGAADSELALTAPIEFTLIRPLDQPDNKFFFCSTENGNGVMDSEYNMMIEPKYNNIFYVDDERFVVMSKKSPDGEGLDNWQISTVNGSGELLSGPIDGFINGNEHFTNYMHQCVFLMPDGNLSRAGVVDADMNVIIEPEYTDISVFSEENPNQFYVCTNKQERCAVFGAAGIQKTDFDFTSVYDAQTFYHNELRDHEFG